MTTKNPLCTNGVAERDDAGTVTALCGCGWSESGFPSRRKALMTQKLHRFPPLDVQPDELSSDAGGAARAPRREATPPHAQQTM